MNDECDTFDTDEYLARWRARREAERSLRLARRAQRRRLYAGVVTMTFFGFATFYLIIHVLIAVVR
jgi:hypothetical protein